MLNPARVKKKKVIRNRILLLAASDAHYDGVNNEFRN